MHLSEASCKKPHQIGMLGKRPEDFGVAIAGALPPRRPAGCRPTRLATTFSVFLPKCCKVYAAITAFVYHAGRTDTGHFT